MSAPDEAVARLTGLTHRYGSRTALDSVTLDLPAGVIAGVIGPDGVGKSSLLGLIAGTRKIQAGRAVVLGGDMANKRHRRAVCPRIAYMPQGLGSNLYGELSVFENVDFFARLFGQAAAERKRRIAELLARTGLAPFADRPAQKLSGGMKQKLGLCCALVHDPDLLILDEPTTGVDPLSRRQFWTLIDTIRARRPGMSLLVATAYMEEAERFDWLVAMNAGRVLARGRPAALKAQTGARTLEEAFVALLPGSAHAPSGPLVIPPLTAQPDGPAIVARDLTQRFGDFTAVDRVNFSIARGEIFGFLGSNGCGKTTTMKMLTGLLAPSGGEALMFGRNIRAGDHEARRRVGYMSQSFSLYNELTVRQNLDLHARLFHVPAAQAAARIARLMTQFDLAAHADLRPPQLPLGLRQRLSLAVAVVHEPEMLILDEPTSGVDPAARDRFWALLIDLSRNQSVTIFISTHFMNEAARCDRVALMHAGRVLATDTPANLVTARHAATLEEAFIAYLEDAEAPVAPTIAAPAPPAPPIRRSTGLSLQRLMAYAHCETLAIRRDPVRLTVSLLGTVLLMLVFGYGITMDVERLTFAAVDRDQTPESRRYLEEFRGSRYFVETPELASQAALERALRSGRIALSIEVPPGFGRDVTSGRPTEVAAWIDGAMPFRAETIEGYLAGLHQSYLEGLAARQPSAAMPDGSGGVEARFRYNQDFRSIFAMVPSTIALLLVFIPAILMALGVVREKELGSIINLYVTPVRGIEFLLGKQLPYVVLAMANYLCLVTMAVLLFGVPLKGSVAALTLGALLYVTATTGIGLLVSAFTKTQIAALFGTAIVTMMPATQFSGMLVPVSSLSGGAAIFGTVFPTTYFLQISVGAFTKSLDFAELLPSLLALAAFIPVLTALSLFFLPEQDR